MNKAIALLVLFLFSLANLPKTTSDALRSCAVASLAPAWQGASSFKSYLSDRPIGKRRTVSLEALDKLELENQLLRADLEQMRESQFAGPKLPTSMAARVIYRDPTAWSSSLWIDIGREDAELIEKNSPVVAGSSLIGVVDYVGKRQSRVRLLTDSGIAPAVRVARGKVQNRHLALELQTVRELLQSREDLFFSEEEKISFSNALTTLTTRLEKEENTLYLAKGELQGSSAPLWRSRKPLLKGIGFNFETLSEGETRPEDASILKKGDLLVTSGLDGLFPPGLSVATVLSFKEAGYMYELDARPTARDFNNLGIVYVLPAIHMD